MCGADQEEEFDGREADFVVWKRTFEGIQSYVARGRRFGRLTDMELDATFAKRMCECGSDPKNLIARDLVGDILYEYSLRKAEPPREIFEAEMAKVRVVLRQQWEAMSAERKDELGAALIAEYESARKQPH